MEDEQNAALVGRAVRKYFKGHGFFGGQVVAYDKTRKYFRVNYADGDREELEVHELKAILVDGPPPAKRPRGRPRKKPLPADGNKLNNEQGHPKESVCVPSLENAETNHNEVNLQKEDLRLEVEDRENGVQYDNERPRKKARKEETKEEGKETVKAHRRKSSLVERQYTFRHTPIRRLHTPTKQHEQMPETPDKMQLDEVVPQEEGNEPIKGDDIPSLPPSSVDYNLPSGSILHLFSAYTFLRSFGWVIFLSPFSLREFIYCLSVTEANPIVDQVHLSLLLLLRQHLQNLANEGVESAANCLRLRDWNLLDVVTWPSYMVAYLLNENYRLEGKEKLLQMGILKKEYYDLDVNSKIRMLSFLCDRMLDTDEVRSELLKRTHGENEVELPEVRSTPSERRITRRSAFGDTPEVVDQPGAEEKRTEDWNSDDCVLCGMDGNLICCDGCPAAYHSRCVGVARTALPEGDWFCPECTFQRRTNEGTGLRKVLRGFESLGVDIYGRRYVAVYEHLFISQSPSLDAAYVCYGPPSVPSCVELLNSSGAIGPGLRGCITRHWKIPKVSDEVLQTPTQGSEKCGEAKHSVVMKPGETWVHSKRDSLGTANGFKTGTLQEYAFEACNYVNQYALGGVAASAASNLAARSSNKRVAVQRTQIFEQMKAFCEAPGQFYWPSFKRKRMEGPKDRCGWCFACKNLNRKKGCLLNTAATKNSAGAAIVPGGLRPTRKGANHLPALIAYVLYMEERLNGLLAGGSWEYADQRKRWRKRVESAKHVGDLNHLLAEFGGCLRPIALTRNWATYAEDAPKLVPSSALNSTEYFPTRGRRRKTVQALEPIKIFIGGNPWGIQWWRGGKLVRRFQDWEWLPLTTLKRAARQGGMKKIPGLLYSDNLELPRRTAQSAWIARAEQSFSVSGLAIQVRTLNTLIRWGDLSVPEEVKELMKDQLICDKICEGNVTKYLVGTSKPEDELKQCLTPEFTSSPSDFVKMIIGEASECKYRVWLTETQVPLCLIRDFEENWRSQIKHRKTIQVERPRTSRAMKFRQFLDKIYWAEVEAEKRRLKMEQMEKKKLEEKKRLEELEQKRAEQFEKKRIEQLERRKAEQLLMEMKKAERKKLEMKKLEQAEKNYRLTKKLKCEDCDLEIDPSDGGCCQECQGDFHKQCMKRSMCESCFIVKYSSRSRRMALKAAETYESPLSKAASKATWLSKSLNVYTRRRNHKQSGILPAVGAVVFRKKRSKRRSGGVKWKMDKELTYRRDKLLLPGESEGGPRCAICLQPYDSRLLYISCEHCSAWFHGEALAIKEKNLGRVAGFECHICRNKSGPSCPYAKSTDRRSKENVAPEGEIDQSNDDVSVNDSLPENDELVLSEIGNWSGAADSGLVV